MKAQTRRFQWHATWIASLTFLSVQSQAARNTNESVQKVAEAQIRNILEPLLGKYCRNECKLMNIQVKVDTPTLEESAPGFDDLIPIPGEATGPATASVKILMGDKFGPVSKKKLLELMEQYLETLDYPVKVETQATHFPIAEGFEGKVTELRDRVTRKFLDNAQEFISKFCPSHCLLTNFELKTEVVNGEEAQYGSSNEYIQEGDTAVRVKSISAALVMDQTLSVEEQDNLLEMFKLGTNSYKNVAISGKSLKFPRSSESIASLKQAEEKQLAAIEKKAADEAAAQAELHKLKWMGIAFGSSLLLLIFLVWLSSSSKKPVNSSRFDRLIKNMSDEPPSQKNSNGLDTGTNEKEQAASRSSSPRKDQFAFTKRYEIERLLSELNTIFAHEPKVAKQVFSRVLTEEGVEVTAECIHLLGESIVLEMLHDPSLQSDLAELIEFYAKNPIDLDDDSKLELLRKLQSRTVAGKLIIFGNRSFHLFDFLSDMDGLQILELVRNESVTVQSVVLTQCDQQKRAVIYSHLDAEVRLKLLSELSRIDYLPKNYIFNIAAALKKKRRENPRLNTDALPGSEVLVSLLEKTGQVLQKSVIKDLEVSNPNSARNVKSKLVSIETLLYLRDGQLLEVILSLKHDELIQFMKGSPLEIRKSILSKCPQELVFEMEEELTQVSAVSREVYQSVERKILNRIKIMANEGQINLVETNERMFEDHIEQGPTFHPHLAREEAPHFHPHLGATNQRPPGMPPFPASESVDSEAPTNPDIKRDPR